MSLWIFISGILNFFLDIEIFIPGLELLYISKFFARIIRFLNHLKILKNKLKTEKFSKTNENRKISNFRIFIEEPQEFYTSRFSSQKFEMISVISLDFHHKDFRFLRFRYRDLGFFISRKFSSEILDFFFNFLIPIKEPFLFLFSYL